MNINYLMHYIAHSLHTIIRSFTPDKTPVERIDHSISHEDFLDVRTEAVDFFLDLPENRYPLLSAVNQDILYATIHAPEQIYVIGPVHVYGKLHIRHSMDKIEYRFTDLYSSEFFEYTRLILLAHNLFYDQPISQDDFFSFNCTGLSGTEIQQYYSSLLFHNREKGSRHNPYSQEVRMLSSIEEGDLLMLEKSRNEEYIGEYGILAQNPERSFRNLGISVITLISRAAIRGGVNPELAFSLCDSYIMQIESLKTLTELAPLVEGAKTAYATMVHELKQRKHSEQKNLFHPLVEQAKDFVYSHLHGKITLKEVADEVHANPNYLSELFRKHEGISFSDFVMTEKINLAKNLLIYSPYSYISIAAYLGFSSQSHLGQQFKRTTGMTLREYRNRFASTEFHE